MSYRVFDRHAAQYDAWYDTPAGKTLLQMEVACLKPFLQQHRRPWLEVGVGTGRFAEALGIEYGIDPAPAMGLLAKARGVRVVTGFGEKLPFPDASFGAVLIAFALEDVAQPTVVLREARRVLAPGGGLIIGLLLKGSPWADFYETEAKEGHTFLSKVRFFSRNELETMLWQSGLSVVEYRTTLFQAPGKITYEPELPSEGYLQSGGFVAVLAKATKQVPGR